MKLVCVLYGFMVPRCLAKTDEWRVFSMNQLRQQKTQDSGTTKDAIVIKPSNIRIWIHDKDIGKLARVLWEGQGNRLRTEVSSNSKVKKFLDAVPFLMNIVKEVHSAVIDNDIESVVSKTMPPAPRMLLTSKDANGLTPLHKASGLAHARIVEYILNTSPESASEVDFSGKTPLHWAASAKNNPRSYNLLVQAGCDEQALDYKMKTPAYYKAKPNDIDRSLLTVIPEAPRVPQQGLPPGYEWNMLTEDVSSTNQTNVRNNFIKKSLSTYESYSILSDEPPPKTLTKRHVSSEEIRNGNLLSPTSPKLAIPNSVNVDPDAVPRNAETLTPLTTEEQAVLVAIDPVNERLYARTPSNASPNISARADTPIPDFNANDDENELDEVEDTEADIMTDIDLETGIELNKINDDAQGQDDKTIENDDVINGDANENNGDDVNLTDEIDVQGDNVEVNNTKLFIYQRAFNPNENTEAMYSLESEDTLKDESEETTIVNNVENEEEETTEKNEDDKPDEELGFETDVETNDEKIYLSL